MDLAFSEDGVSGLEEGLKGNPSIVNMEEGGTGVGCGQMPATMQSSWKTAVTSTSSGGAFGIVGAPLPRGLARIRATLM